MAFHEQEATIHNVDAFFTRFPFVIPQHFIHVINE